MASKYLSVAYDGKRQKTKILDPEDITPTVIKEMTFSRIIDHAVYDGCRVALLSLPPDPSDVSGFATRVEAIRAIPEEQWQTISEQKVLAYWSKRRFTTHKNREDLLGIPDYYVFKILKHDAKKKKFLVQWVGYPATEATWEPEPVVLDIASDIAKQFMEDNSIKSKKTTKTPSTHIKKPPANVSTEPTKPTNVHTQPKGPAIEPATQQKKRPAIIAGNREAPEISKRQRKDEQGQQEVRKDQDEHAQQEEQKMQEKQAAQQGRSNQEDHGDQNGNHLSTLAEAVKKASKAAESASKAAESAITAMMMMEARLKSLEAGVTAQDRRIDQLEVNISQLHARVSDQENAAEGLLRLSP